MFIKPACDSSQCNNAPARSIRRKKTTLIHSQVKRPALTLLLFSQRTSEWTSLAALWLMTCSLVLPCIYPQSTGSSHLHMWCLSSGAGHKSVRSWHATRKMMSTPWSPSVHVPYNPMKHIFSHFDTVAAVNMVQNIYLFSIFDFTFKCFNALPKKQ